MDDHVTWPSFFLGKPEKNKALAPWNAQKPGDFLGEFPKNWGTPKCLVYHGKFQSKMDDDWGPPSHHLVKMWMESWDEEEDDDADSNDGGFIRGLSMDYQWIHWS